MTVFIFWSACLSCAMKLFFFGGNLNPINSGGVHYTSFNVVQCSSMFGVAEVRFTVFHHEGRKKQKHTCLVLFPSCLAETP